MNGDGITHSEREQMQIDDRETIRVNYDAPKVFISHLVRLLDVVSTK